MTARTISTIALLRALEGPIDATILKEAKARLEEMPDSLLTPYIVSKIWETETENSIEDSNSSINKWLSQWLNRNKTIRPAQAILEVNLNSQVLAIAEELVRQDPPAPFTGSLAASLLTNKNDKDTLLLAENWLSHNAFSSKAKEVMQLLLRHGSEIKKETYLNGLAIDASNYGIFVALLKYQPSAKAARASKRFIKLHPGTYESAVVLGNLIRTRRLKQEKKWIDLWLQAQDYRPAGYFSEVLEACFARKKPSKYALSLTKWLATTVQPPGAYPFKLLLKRKNASETRALLLSWLQENLAPKKAKLHLLTLIEDRCDAQAVSLAKQWLIGKSIEERESVIEALVSRGIHESELVALADENLRELPDSYYSLFIAEALLACDFEKYSNFIKSGLKDGRFKDMYDLFMATRAIYKVKPDEELMAEFDKWLEIVPYFHRDDRHDLSGWLPTVYETLMEIAPSEARKEQIEAWLVPAANLSSPARKRLKRLLQTEKTHFLS